MIKNTGERKMELLPVDIVFGIVYHSPCATLGNLLLTRPSFSRILGESELFSLLGCWMPCRVITGLTLPQVFNLYRSSPIPGTHTIAMGKD